MIHVLYKSVFNKKTKFYHKNILDVRFLIYITLMIWGKTNTTEEYVATYSEQNFECQSQKFTIGH